MNTLLFGQMAHDDDDVTYLIATPEKALCDIEIWSNEYFLRLADMIVFKE